MPGDDDDDGQQANKPQATSSTQKDTTTSTQEPSSSSPSGRKVPRSAIYVVLAAVMLVFVAASLGRFCGTGNCSSSWGSSSDGASSREASPSSTTGTDDSAGADADPVVDDLPPSASPTSSPPTTAVPTSILQQSLRSAAISEFIDSITLSAGGTIDYYPGSADAVTAEEQAVQWLITEDPLQLSVGDDSDQLFRLQQRYALLTLWFQNNVTITGGPWTESSGWLLAEDECDWFGITCVRGVVTALELEENNINGRIPDDLGLLTSLITLDLNFNDLSSTLPVSIGQLSNLELLHVPSRRIVSS